MPRLLSIFATGCALLSSAAMAGDLFLIDANMNGQNSKTGFNTAEEAADLYTSGQLSQFLSGYNGTQAVTSTLNFRGLPVNLAYPTANNTQLVFAIPSLNITQSFQGATRDESQALFKDYLKKNPDLLARMQKELVRVSPVDPVAGNPNSLMSRTASMDFAQGFALNSPTATGGDASNKFGIGVSYSHMVAEAANGLDSQDTDTISLPLSYAHKFEQPNHEIIINIPLAYSKANDAKSYDAGLGVIYRFPVQERWVLTVGGNVRAVGSVDLLSGAALASGSIMSSYMFGDPDGDWTLTMGNMVTLFRSLSGRINGTSYNPDLQNTVFKNGLLYARRMSGDDKTLEVYIIDTYFTGTKLFSNHQDELGVTWGTRRPAHAKETDYRIGVSMLTGENLKPSFQLNFGAWF